MMKPIKSGIGEFVLIVCQCASAMIATFLIFHFVGRCKIPPIASKTAICSSGPRVAICRPKKHGKFSCGRDWRKINCVRYGIFPTWIEMDFLILMNTWLPCFCATLSFRKDDPYPVSYPVQWYHRPNENFLGRASSRFLTGNKKHY